MKTKEVIFYEATGRQFHRFAFGPAILDAMQLYSDQQNKELRESMDRGIEASQRMVEGELLEKDAEIQRLTKEVEELSWVEDEIDTAREWMKVHEGENSRYLQIQEELTRLRELLGRVKHFIEDGTDQDAEQLLSEINALNPVYSPPYIEGKTDLQNEG